jgi:tetratricopeptide (TPR) repeat protein
MPDVPGPKWTRSILHHILGRLAESAARPREAEASYRKAIELGPNSALYHNDLAWLLVAYPDDAIRDAEQAISLAKRAIDIQPKAANVWNTLGVAQYRAGEYREAIESLKHAESLAPGADFGANAFFIAMAQWRLGEHTTARQWFDRAVEWMDKNQPNNAELRRFRTEAAELFGIR